MICRSVRQFGIAFFLITIAAAMLAADIAGAIGFDRDDFIITGFISNRVAVYDHDLTFKGYFIDQVRRPTGLDFDGTGNLVIGRQSQAFVASQVLLYDRFGAEIGSFESADLGDPLDVKVGLNGNYFIGTQDFNGGDGLTEFSRDGDTIRRFGSGDYEGVAVLPDGVLWGGVGKTRSSYDVFSTETGESVGTIAFDNGQQKASSMMYSRLTESVLLTDQITTTIYERDVFGKFIRTFKAPGIAEPFGVTRGPLGDVYALDFEENGVYRWSADGIYVGFTSLLPSITGPVGIVWAGNVVPEPSSLLILILGSSCLMWNLRRKRRS